MSQCKEWWGFWCDMMPTCLGSHKDTVFVLVCDCLSLLVAMIRSELCGVIYSRQEYLLFALYEPVFSSVDNRVSASLGVLYS